MAIDGGACPLAHPAPPAPRFFLQLLEQRLSAPDCAAAGWLLDGFPHTKGQAGQLAAAGFVPDKAILLEGPHALLVERIRWAGALGARARGHSKSILRPAGYTHSLKQPPN
jgi:adenylate kinase family enzyme